MSDAAKRMEITLTYDDYRKFPDDKQRYELVKGELFMTPSPGYLHQRVSQNLEFFLYSHIRKSGSGVLLHAPMDVILSETTVVQPDILFVTKKRLGIITERGVEGAPDLVVEILSPTTIALDRFSKFQIYGKLGVRWYWIVDPGQHLLEEYKNDNGIFVQKSIGKKDEVFMPSLFKGLELDLGTLWL
jgi:Uma2 family endonuclease